MKKQLGALTGALYLSAGALAATADFEDYARVVKVTPQIEEANWPEGECSTEEPGKAQRHPSVAEGAMAGSRLDSRNEAGTEQPARQCHTVHHWHTRIKGYTVTYEYRGHSYTSTIPYDPGDRLKVRVSIAPDV